MSRVKLSEYRAKHLFIPNYQGVSLSIDTLSDDIDRLDGTQLYIIKVDQGIKKRGKQGLIRLNTSKSEAEIAVRELAARGFDRFIAEPMVPHDDSLERYVSFERTRDRILINFSTHGGVDIEENTDSVSTYGIDTVPLPEGFASRVVEIMDREHLSFVEFNPLLVDGESVKLLDAAVLADSAGAHMASWKESDIVEATRPTEHEHAIAQMNASSPSAFSLRVLNPDGAIWLLLSGGGASITIADEAANAGSADKIGNYGEYSGGPTADETYLYTTTVLKQLFASSAPKKALIIAGGVANFTDVRKTFGGIIKALDENLESCHRHNMKIFVRRGGPNEKEGLENMRSFLEKNELFGSVHGSDILLTDVIHEALEYVNA